MTLGRFREAPRAGHLEALKHFIGYLRRRPDGCIRFRTNVPNYEHFGEPVKYNWMESVCGNPTELVDENAPALFVRISSFTDANLMHDTATGRSASDILKMLNSTPIDWFNKRQGQVETATYGSDFMVARQAVGRIVDLRHQVRLD